MVAGSIMIVNDDELEFPTKEQAVYSLIKDIKSIYNYIYNLIY